MLRPSQYSGASTQRLTDAQKLCERQRWTATIYLAGYGVECALKAELASELRRIGGWVRNQDHPLYRAVWTHDLPAIAGVLAHPPDLARDIRSVAETWSVELRYSSKAHARSEAESLLALARQIASRIAVRLVA
jgi:hypothetical protein